jgi:hypothetical protein
MAITRTQIAKQLLAKGGRIGLFKGAEADARAGRGDISPGTDRRGNVRGGNGGNNYTDRIIDVAERKRRQDLRDITNRIEQEKTEERLEKFRNLGSNQRKFQNFLTKISPIAAFTSKFGPLNNRDFLVDKVLDAGRFKYKGDVLTREQFVNLSEEEKEDVLDSYLGQRNMGEIDAYGNPIGDRGGDGPKPIIPVDTTFAQAPSITEEEPEETFSSNIRLLAGGGMAEKAPYEGGIMDLESARQMYGLGKLVKKVTRSVKKIAKSPLGKAAIGAALFKFGSPLFKQGGAFNNFFFAGEAPSFAALTSKGALTGIAAVSALGGLTAEEDDETPQYVGADLPFPVDYYLSGQYAPNMRLAAEGGLMRTGYQEGSKEPVAKKTMPLLDMGGMEKDYREEGGFVPIGRMEKADDVPARLSKNEFVFTADAVRNAGDGDVDLGAEKMYNMMKNLEAGGDVSEESQGMDGARKMFQTSQRLEEVI